MAATRINAILLHHILVNFIISNESFVKAIHVLETVNTAFQMNYFVQIQGFVSVFGGFLAIDLTN